MQTYSSTDKAIAHSDISKQISFWLGIDFYYFFIEQSVALHVGLKIAWLKPLQRGKALQEKKVFPF